MKLNISSLKYLFNGYAIIFFIEFEMNTAFSELLFKNLYFVIDISIT